MQFPIILPGATPVAYRAVLGLCACAWGSTKLLCYYGTVCYYAATVLCSYYCTRYYRSVSIATQRAIAIL